MKITLDQNTIQMIDIFRNLTGATAVDCIQEDDFIYFVVAKGEYGLAVGKAGVKIKNAERVFKKPIKVFEHADTIEEFIRNIVPDAQEIAIEGGHVAVRVSQKDRAKIIGRAGKNVKILNKFLQRLFDVEEMKVK